MTKNEDTFARRTRKTYWFSIQTSVFSRVHATLQPAMSVGSSVRVSCFGITGGFCINAPAQMLGLAFMITAPAHPHATSVVVYTALFFNKRVMYRSTIELSG